MATVNVVTIAAYRRIYCLRLISLVQRSAATWRSVLHSSDEPGELSHCYDDSTINIVVAITITVLPYHASDVKSSRPDCPRGRNFVLGLDLSLDMLSSASSSSSGIWPRHVLRLCNLASSICVFHDEAQANDLHSTIRSMPSQYKFTIYSHLTCLDDYWQNVCRDD